MIWFLAAAEPDGLVVFVVETPRRDAFQPQPQTLDKPNTMSVHGRSEELPMRVVLDYPSEKGVCPRRVRVQEDVASRSCVVALHQTHGTRVSLARFCRSLFPLEMFNLVLVDHVCFLSLRWVVNPRRGLVTEPPHHLQT